MKWWIFALIPAIFVAWACGPGPSMDGMSSVKAALHPGLPFAAPDKNYAYIGDRIRNVEALRNIPWQQVNLPSFPELKIKLFWLTPGDPDKTDQCRMNDCGSDMDLHFLNPNGRGHGMTLPDGSRPGYYSIWDCNMFNRYPLWTLPSDNKDYNPDMLRDDGDGGGPEIIMLPRLRSFSDGRCYRIGVHYYSDHGYGPSFAMLKLYSYGRLVWENSPLEMKDSDLWEAVKVCEDPTTGDFRVESIHDANGRPVIYHNIHDDLY